jgi:hypothetical protein
MRTLRQARSSSWRGDEQAVSTRDHASAAAVLIVIVILIALVIVIDRPEKTMRTPPAG